MPTQRPSRPRPSGKEQSSEGGGIENRHRFGGCLRSTGSPFQVVGPTSGGDLAPSLGGRKKNFADEDFRMMFFRKNFPFSRPKILMTFFVIDQVFLIFSFFKILRIFT